MFANEYLVEYDGIDECATRYYVTSNYGELIRKVEKNLLEDFGGGSADIYDLETDELLETIEI